MQPDRSNAGAVALDDLRRRILAIDADMTGLMTQRQALVDEYERVRHMLMGMAPPPAAQPYPQPTAPTREEWSGARVRGLLLGLGAALLAISALAFTAVAWSRLGEGGRALLLLAMTAVVTGLSVALRRRLPASAEALAGLAVVLILVDVYALRRAGLGAGMSWQVWWAAGTAVAAGFAAALGRLVGRRTTRLAVAMLLPLSAELLAGRFAGNEWVGSLLFGALAATVAGVLLFFQSMLTSKERVALRLHGLGSWVAAAGLAAIGAGQADTVAAALGPALAVAVLAAAPELARRATPARHRIAATVVAGVPAGVALTLAGPALSGEAVLTTAVIAGGATMLASLVLPADRRAPALIAGLGFAAPGTAAAVATAMPSVLSPLAWLNSAWMGTVSLNARDAAEGPGTAAFVQESWPAVGTFVTMAAVGLVLAIRNQHWLGITTAATAFAAALAPLSAGASVLVALVATVSVAVAGVLLAALVDRAELRHSWTLLPGAAIAAVPATGWAAVSPAASVATLAVGAGTAVVATSITRTVPAARCGFAALAAGLAVTLTGVVTRAAGADVAVGGFAAAVAAGAVVLAGVHLLRHPAVGVTVEVSGAVCALVAVGVAAQSAPWLAGALTALVPVAAVGALRPSRRLLYAAAAGALTLAAIWAWLSAAHVSVVEAYTAPAAAVALAAGLLSWRRGQGRSWLTLGPALALAIGPTLALGLLDDDAVRLVIAAVLAFAAVIAGAVAKLQAPLGIGAVALLILALDQWGDDIVRMPRWITIGVIGVALMWIGATFEHRRRDWRRASDALVRFG